NPNADRAAIAALIAGEIEKVRTQPVSADELREAKNQLVAAAPDNRETAHGRAFELGEALVTYGDAKAADRNLQAITRVTAADVQRVAQRWLDPRSAVSFTYTQGPGGPVTYAN